MSERKPANVTDGLTVCWAVIFTVWCADTGRMFWWIVSTGPLVGFYIGFRIISAYLERRK